MRQIYKILLVLLLRLFFTCNGSPLKKNSTREYDPKRILKEIFNANMDESSISKVYDEIKEKWEIKKRDKYDWRDIDFPKVNPDGTITVSFDDDDARNRKKSLDGGIDAATGEAGGENQRKKRRRRRRKPRRQLPSQQYAYLGNPGIYPPVNDGVPFPPGIYRPPRRSQGSTLTNVVEALVSMAQNDDLMCISRLLCEAALGRADQRLKAVVENVNRIIDAIPAFAAQSGINAVPILAAVTVFGRGIFIGLSAEKNRTECYTAFPLCPQDPQQVIHYLNNYKGGFFRFFRFGNNYQAYGQPAVPGQYGFQAYPGQNGYQQPSGPGGYGQQIQGAAGYGQELQGAGGYEQQFQGATGYGQELQGAGGYGQQIQGAAGYGQELQGASGYGQLPQGVGGYGQQYQGAGGYGHQQNLPGQFSQPQIMRYGQQQNLLAQNYGYYQPNSGGHYPAKSPNQYGLYPNTNQQSPTGFQRPNLYQGYHQNYGNNYPYYRKRNVNDTVLNNSTEEAQKEGSNTSTIQKRIQNQKPKYVNNDFDDYEVTSSWKFPFSHQDTFYTDSTSSTVRGSRNLRFPDKDENIVEHNEINRTSKGILFPGAQSNRSYYQFYNYNNSANNNHLKFDGQVVDSQSENYNKNENYEEIETVYVVRGNGDPNHPEIVKVPRRQKGL